ncbi:MAG: hypothetical protein HC803_02495 [Saprospiraceae bacterium]|nr:hypothetical protein [Saprospiraceae bacterium]
MFLILACLISVSGFGQQRKAAKQSNLQIYPGYVITANHNDTLFGEVKFLNPVFNEETLIFYKDGEEFIYHPAQGIISEYGFQYKHYNKETKSIEPQWFVYIRKLVPKSANSFGAKEAFIERQIYDEIILYNYYVLETYKINSRKYIHNYFIEKQGVDGFELIAITRENYRETVREYLVLGNDEIEKHLGTNGFGYKYLADLVAIQNAWLSGNPDYEALLNYSKGLSSTELN